MQKSGDYEVTTPSPKFELIGKGFVGLDKEKKQNPAWKDKWQ